jgi:hypothetical protein
MISTSNSMLTKKNKESLEARPMGFPEETGIQVPSTHIVVHEQIRES